MNLMVSNFLKNSFIYYSLWEFKVKSKKKKKKNGPAHEGPPIKPVKPAGKPVKPAGKPVKPVGKPVKPAGKPVARELLNLDLNSNRPVNRSEPVAWEFLNLFEFGFEFNRFPPVTGLTGPVNRYRRAAVRPVRSDFKTLGPTQRIVPLLPRLPAAPGYKS